MAEPASTIGRYEILREIGRGAMGVVYEAHDPVLDRTIALKVIQPSAEGEAARVFEERFLAEARIAAALQHPGIVVVHDVGRDPSTGALFIALELLRGRDPGRPRRARPARLAHRAAARRPGGARAPPRPPPRRRAPRHQAGQRGGPALRRSEGHGLRHRPPGDRAPAPDHHGRVHRHAPLHGPGAGEDRGRRRPGGRLLAGLGRLHAAHRAGRLLRAHDPRDRAPRRLRGARAALALRAGPAPRRRARARPRAGEGPC